MFKFNFSIKSLAAVFMMSAAVAASSCKKDEEMPEPPEPPYLEVEEAEVFFNKWVPATRELAVRSNVHFTATSDEPWCIATVRKEEEEDSLLIAVEGNDGNTVRTAHITLAGEGVPPVVLEVGQATDAPYINISEAQQWILLGRADAYSSKRTVRTNRPVSVTSDQAWCSVTMMDYDVSRPTQEYQLEVTQNDDMLHARDATITLSYSGLDPVHIKVTQPANLMGTAATWQEAANQRIEQCRKNDVRIKVTQGGAPLSGASVAVDMTEHEFLFGCYADHYVYYGTYPGLDAAKADAYLSLWVDLFNYATVPFYWEFEPEEGQSPNSNRAPFVQWYKEHGVHHVKGHPLVYSFMPDWARALSREDLYELVLDRIEESTSYFDGSVRAPIDYWDVVNEATDGKAISQYGGIVNFTKECLKAARRGNPNAKLLMNEMGVSDGYVTLLRKMVDDAGQPLYDAIGIQSHMHNGAWNAQEAWRICETMARFGMPIHFTETTITSSRQMGGTTNPAEEELQKNELIDWYTIIFSHPSVEAISWWNLSDYAAWMGAAAGLLNWHMEPKPAYYALKKLIKEDWATHETLPTNANGEVQLRAFRGKYRITVTPSGGGTPKIIEDVVVGKGENMVEVPL
ncbi:hypothetical protein AGMMS49965_13840 [Bacteroidia bacterium]|nr:hypothetical protein AGMMS49965_13840 [Bacteroidia bacterium]